jgi:hypothetical protein
MAAIRSRISGILLLLSAAAMGYASLSYVVSILRSALPYLSSIMTRTEVVYVHLLGAVPLALIIPVLYMSIRSLFGSGYSYPVMIGIALTLLVGVVILHYVNGFTEPRLSALVTRNCQMSPSIAPNPNDRPFPCNDAGTDLDGFLSIAPVVDLVAAAPLLLTFFMHIRIL